MDRERFLAQQTVVVENGKITTIGPVKSTTVPRGATRIDGRGKFLIPGLHDMHTHLLSDDRIPDSLARYELAVILANGITTARIPIGKPSHLVLREQTASGALPGPRLFLGSPQLSGRSFGDEFNGRVVTNAAEASQAVRDFKAQGYDFIKLTFFITPEVYDAVISTARVEDIRVIGHVDQAVGLARALAAGQQIEHLDSYLQALLPAGASLKRSVDGVYVWQPKAWESLDLLDSTRIPELAGLTARAGVWSTPTLTFLKNSFGTGESDSSIKNRLDYRFFPEHVREEMYQTRAAYWKNPPSEARRQRYVRLRDALAKEIHDSGGHLMAGSDAPEWFLLYGFALHAELGNLVAAGLTPYAALEAATRNPAEWLGTLPNSGTVENGKSADLVLLDANPLSDITATRRITGVMARGWWYPRAELDRMLDQAADKVGQAH
jgi:imidazolonepropionase-like amidohydrolase